MAAFFQSLQKTLIAGVVLLIVLILVVGLISGQYVRPDHNYWTFIMRWLHVLSGVMWIGLLWYFNFVQTPTMPTIQPVEHRAAVSKFIAPNALFWFRHGAAATVLTGLLLAWMNGYIVQALLLQKGHHAIGIGMWLALIMAFNVWFIIWPNQKKALGLVEASADEKASAARLAGMTSRINTMLSLPMLYCMVAQQNAGL
ncbi:MAG: urate hydroxylase PuuD [Xanthobacteraceae bacterium]